MTDESKAVVYEYNDHEMLCVVAMKDAAIHVCEHFPSLMCLAEFPFEHHNKIFKSTSIGIAEQSDQETKTIGPRFTMAVTVDNGRVQLMSSTSGTLPDGVFQRCRSVYEKLAQRNLSGILFEVMWWKIAEELNQVTLT